MALQFYSSTRLSLRFNCHHHQSSKPGHDTQRLRMQFTRRKKLATTAALMTAVLLNEASSSLPAAFSLDLRITAPDQTLEEADAGVKVHAQELLQVKGLIDSESWREAQLALRESSSRLKQDLYTMIQAKPGSQRPQLRKLYSTLFNTVSRLDYAARDRDANLVQECYDNIVAALDEIFAKL